MFLLCSGHLKSYLFVSVRPSWKDHAPLEDLRARVHVEPDELRYQFNILHWLCPQALHGILLKEGLAGVIPPPPPPTLTWSKPGPTILFGLH